MKQALSLMSRGDFSPRLPRGRLTPFLEMTGGEQYTPRHVLNLPKGLGAGGANFKVVIMGLRHTIADENLRLAGVEPHLHRTYSLQVQVSGGFAESPPPDTCTCTPAPQSVRCGGAVQVSLYSLWYMNRCQKSNYPVGS